MVTQTTAPFQIPESVVGKKMNKSFVPILLLTILLSCKPTIETFQTSDSNKLGVKSNRFRGTIFKTSYDEPYFLPIDGLTKFTPTKEDIALTEAILNQQLEKANNSRINQRSKRQYVDKNLNKYFRQYIGFINEKGERIVHVNFHWDKYTIADRLKGYWDDRLNYDSDFSTVLDGGSRYWNINVNLTTKTLYGLSVNGIA